jgi:hypothetical protein
MTPEKKLIIVPVTPEEISLYSKSGYSIYELMNRKGTDNQIRHELNSRGNIEILVIDENNNNKGHSEEELKREQRTKPYAVLTREYKEKAAPSIITCNEAELSDAVINYCLRSNRKEMLPIALTRASLKDYIPLLIQKHYVFHRLII